MPPSLPPLFDVASIGTVLLASLCVGCGQPPRELPEVLACVDAQYLERRGRLTFVNNVHVGCTLASEHGLPCLFFFTAEWCTYCHRMAETAFADEAVGCLGEQFICVLVDADRERNLCQHLAVTGYPTVEFVSPHGQSLHRLVGQQSPADLVAGMQAALMRSAWIKGSVVR